MRYTVEIHTNDGGVRRHDVETITAGRAEAEMYGTMADHAYIYRRGTDTIVAMHRRDRNNDGTRWYRAGW